MLGALCSVLCFSALAAPNLSQLPPPAAKQVDFAADIRPIFEQSCLRCHGPERPKSRFRLDNHESALKGGAQGVDIIPGDSANSPLIHNVARLDADMAMPPEGKGDPLTTEQIALLRAWIDQGAAWGGEETSRFSYTLTPAFGFAAVDGNEAKFREHHWLRDGGRGGLESFEFLESYSPDTKLTLSGRAMTDDYRVEGLLEESELGFVRLGLEQFRKYDSDTGGYVPGLGNSVYSFNRDLHLDVGRAWVDLGLTLPDWPRLVLGYEYQYRRGDKATLQWGPVGALPPFNPATDVRNIYPALKTIDENTHVLKFDAQFERAGWLLEESFRGEWTASQTRRLNGRRLLPGGPDSLATDAVAEGWQSFQGANTLRVEREFREWLHVSAGWLYSHLSADADFNLETRNPAGGQIFPPFLQGPWHSQSIVLERESHVANANALLGPWAGLSIGLGVQAEWTRQNGTVDGLYENFTPAQAKDFIADLDKAALAEHVSLRYTGLPFTTLYAEAKLQQECIAHYESDLGGRRFDRNTDAESDLREFQIGFDSSPRSWLKFGSQFRFFDKETTFDHGFDDFADPIGAYPTFFESLQRTTHEIKSRLTLRPGRHLTTTFTHRLVATDYETDKESRANITTGGRWTSGQYDAQIFSLNTTVTPWPRLSCAATISYQDSESISADDRLVTLNPPFPVVPYRGETWSVMGHARFVLNEKTDLTAAYTFSTADFRQTHFAAGLPLGMDYELHGIQAGFVTRRTKDLTLKLQYGFYRYDEASSGGVNDYTAHAVLAAISLRLP